MAKSWLDWIALILLIVGGVNWGLVGVMDLNLVEKLFGAGSMIAKIVYDLIGLAALYTIYFLFK